MATNYVDKAGLTYVISKIKTLIGGKVDKVSGKGLSTNDYTTAEKTKLNGIATGAEVNVQSDWSSTDTASDAYIKNKPTIPTVGNGTITVKQNGATKGTFTTNQGGNTTIELTDTDTHVTVDSAMSDTSTNPVQNKVVKKAIADAIGSISTIKFEVVTELPATGNSYTIYLKAHSHGSGDAYDEYVYINGAWEKIGNTDIDLSGYVKNTDLTAISTAEIDSMFS